MDQGLWIVGTGEGMDIGLKIVGTWKGVDKGLWIVATGNPSSMISQLILF